MKRKPAPPLDFSPSPGEAPYVAPTALEGFDVRPMRRMREDPQALGGRGVEELGWARHAYLVAIAAGVAWAGALTAFVLAYETGSQAFGYGPFRLAVIAGLAGLPCLFMLLGAHAVRQSARLAAETRRTRALAGDLVAPVALAVVGTGDALESMRAEIAKASAAAADARDQITGLNDALSGETGRLSEAAAAAQRAAADLARAYAHEREEMAALSTALNGTAQQVAQAAQRQTDLLVDAADAVQARIGEAETALSGRAGALSASAEGAAVAADEAGRTLAQQTDRLERAGAFLGERYRGLEASLSDRHASLEGLAELLRADSVRAADLLDAQRASLEAASDRAHGSAAALVEAADGGAAALGGLIVEAGRSVEAAVAAARDGQTALETQARTHLGQFTGKAAEERGAIEQDARRALDALAAAAGETRAAVAGHADEAQRRAADAARLAREQADQLNEAAFAAAQRADQAFEQRLAAARRLIEQSAALVDEAGTRSAARIEQGLGAARAALGTLDALFEEADSRIAAMPATAQAQVEAVRAAVAQGVAELTTAARQAAQDTQAIDAVFQDRVRRNYEMLSEAVRLMGKVAGAAEPRPAAPPPVAAAQPPAAPPVARPAVAQPEPARLAALAGERPTRTYTPAAPDALRPAALSSVEPSASVLGLRPRLKLTAEPASAALRSVVNGAPAAPAPARASAEWTWKDLLSSMDEPPADDEALADSLIAEVEAMGVDSATALPRDGLEAVAAALQAGQADAARELVRTAAPTAVRRLSRRVLTDKVLRQQADRYVRRYGALVGDAARRDPDGFMAATLLASDAGRAFLLLDAAVREPV